MAASVQPGELRYAVTIVNLKREKDDNDHYVARDEIIQARCGVMKGSGANQLFDGAARAVDSVTFIFRWEVRERIRRDATLKFQGRAYLVDWMDAVPWAEHYARVRAISKDEGAR